MVNRVPLISAPASEILRGPRRTGTTLWFRATVTSMECRSITLYSNEWRACRHFYVDFLGLGVVAEGEDQFLALEGSPLCIDAAHGRPPSSGFVLFATGDLDGVRQRAKTMGYQVQREEDRRLRLLDPDGREVEIYQREPGGP